jgi:hypothetical protein
MKIITWGSVALSCGGEINHTTYEYDFVDTGLHA